MGFHAVLINFRQEVLLTALFFCPKCSTVIPFDHDKTYFDIFQMDFLFDLPIPELQKRFKDLQVRLTGVFY